MKPNIDSDALEYIAGALASDPIFCERLAAAIVNHKEKQERDDREKLRKWQASIHHFGPDNVCIRCGEKLWFKDIGEEKDETNLKTKCPKAKVE